MAITNTVALYEQLRKQVAEIRGAVSDAPEGVLTPHQQALLQVIQVETLCSIASDLADIRSFTGDIASAQG